MLEQPQMTLEDLELELCRLPEVSSTRVVADDAGRAAEIHIVAKDTGKTSKQIARDVISVAHASFGLDIDRRIVSVVQLGAASEPSADEGPVELTIPGARPRITGVSTETTGMRAIVRVELDVGGALTTGFAEGSLAVATRPRLVALSTLDALRQLDAGAESLDIENAQVVRVGSHDVAVVAVVFVNPSGEQTISGSAVVRDAKPEEALARAVLDATNRRLPHFA